MGDKPHKDDTPEGKPEKKARRRFRRTRSWLSRHVKPPRTRRGLLLLVAVVAVTGVVVAVSGVQALHWSETVSFCKQCHTMEPQVKAYEISPHREVPCGECHVKPGVSGWVEAKIGGALQYSKLITGTYAKPIHSPERDKLPSTKDTCEECHSESDLAREGGAMNLVLQPQYKSDRSNTKVLTSLIVRGGNTGDKPGTQGAHWHLDKRIEFSSRGDEEHQKVDWVKVTSKNGKSKEFIARSRVSVSSDVRPEIEKIKRSETTREMDCIDCHNRTGHDIPAPGDEIDDAIAAGKISQDIPYIKREGMSRLKATYPSTEAADRAIKSIRKTYAAKYPLVLKKQDQALNEAIEELTQIYPEVATPAMKVTSKTYPNKLGHKSSQGCFSCHDDGHNQVKKGRVLRKTIPSTCTTCHSFPQVNSEVPNVSLSGKPKDHNAAWPFNHGKAADTKGVKGCTTCHQPASCTSCHQGSKIKSLATPDGRRRYRSQKRESDRGVGETDTSQRFK